MTRHIILALALALVVTGVTLLAIALPRRHRHRFTISGVSYPPPPGGIFGGMGATAPNKTNVVYRCCEQPGGLVTVELLGHWEMWMLTGQTLDYPADYETEGGESESVVRSLADRRRPADRRTRNDLLGTDPYAG